MRTLDHELDRGAVAGRQPTAERSAIHARAGRANAAREFLLVAVLYLAYTASRLLAADDRAPALLRAQRLLDFEAVLDLDWEHGIARHVAAHPLVGLLSCYWYSTAHYVITPIVLIWLYRRGRRVYVPARRALLVATALGLVMYLLLPTAPPRMMAGYPDILSIHSNAGWWGADASAPRGTGNLTNQLAAFPSLHAGWSLWVALALHRAARRRSLRIAGWTHAGLTAFVVVGTANHWVLDVIAGWSVVAVAWIASNTRWTGAVALRARRTCLPRVGPQLDRLGELGERRSHPRSPRSVDGEFVVSASEILHEGVPGDDDAVVSVSSPRIGLSRCLSRL